MAGKNHEGYNDPTATAAINNVEAENAKGYVRHRKLLEAIYYICSSAGFEIQGRIVLKDRKTGKIWK